LRHLGLTRKVGSGQLNQEVIFKNRQVIPEVQSGQIGFFIRTIAVKNSLSVALSFSYSTGRITLS